MTSACYWLLALAVHSLQEIADNSQQLELTPDPVQKYKEEQGKPIKHVSWDLFGRQIITLLESGVVKSYSWRLGLLWVIVIGILADFYFAYHVSIFNLFIYVDILIHKLRIIFKIIITFFWYKDI